MQPQVQRKPIAPGAAFIEMAVGAAHLLLELGQAGYSALPVLCNAILPVPMDLSTRQPVMECLVSQKAGGADLIVQSNALHFRASIVEAVRPQKETSQTGEHNSFFALIHAACHFAFYQKTLV